MRSDLVRAPQPAFHPPRPTAAPGQAARPVARVALDDHTRLQQPGRGPQPDDPIRSCRSKNQSTSNWASTLFGQST
eukprot:352594-Chlamydomonas_euryale.AAC.11